MFTRYKDIIKVAMKRKSLCALLLITISFLSVIAFRLYEISNTQMPIQSILFDQIQIDYDQAQLSFSVLGDIIQKDVYFVNDKLKTVIDVNTESHQLLVVENSSIKLIDPNNNETLIEDPLNIVLREEGIYTFVIDSAVDNLLTHYVFKVNVLFEPLISLPKLNVQQGDILYFEIKHVPLDSEISVQTSFSVSEIYQKDNMISFYIPMWYAAKAQEYPLIIHLNDERFDYVIDLLNYEFKELHFTVASSTVSSTVGNPDAITQYREVIYPTYTSAESEVYWQDNFNLPVIDARISSYFGDKRYVNDASVPTRHVGIDYALDCNEIVMASNAGKVIVAQNLIMIGNTVVIDHGLGLKTYYEHMQDLAVKVGDIVDKGQVIGHVGTTGYSTGCHLHFQAMVKDQSFNPEFLYTWMD